MVPPEPPPTLDPIELPCGGGYGGCGSNGGTVAGTPFWWLRLDRVPQHDVQYLHFHKGGKKYTLDVENNVLRYEDEHGWHYGKELEGFKIRVLIKGHQYDIIIAEVHNRTNCVPAPDGSEVCEDNGEPYWTQINTSEAEVYKLRWESIDDPAQRGEVCNSNSIVGINSIRNVRLLYATVFEGEYYDPDTLNITATPTTVYTAPFNVACMGSLPAKQAFTRRTIGNRPGLIIPPWFANDKEALKDDRQALARAWAAEYCPGKSFTHQGHRIRVSDRLGTLYGSEPLGFAGGTSKLQYEAVWNANGAVCLELPRLSQIDPNFPAIPRKEMIDLIVRECGKTNTPPQCSKQPWFPGDWKSHGQFLTATRAGL